MKLSRRFCSLLLAAIMLLTLCATTAFAADGTDDEETNDNTSSTYTYEIYQIFTGDYSNGVLSNVKWGTNGTGTTGEAVDSTTLKALENINSTASDSTKLTTILTYADLTGTAYKTVTGSGTTVTVSDLPDGYYLVKDKDNSLDGKDDSYTTYVVLVVGGEVTITRKADVPEVKKKVKDTNDSDGTTTGWQDSADYDIGDTVPFQLTATLPNNVSEYTTYKVVFHDTLSSGLTFDASSVKVYVDGTEVTTGYTVVNSPTDGCTFEVVITDAKAIGATNNSVITVEYNATLNEQAVLGSTGNPNTVYLEYSNNPNGEGTGKTPEDKVIVFTYKVVVNKVKEDGTTALVGAGFTLYKWVADNSTAGGTWVAVGSEIKGDEMTTFTWSGLDDGNYKLVETTTPDGYNTMADIYFTISATHDTESDNPQLKTLSGNVTTGEVTFTSNPTDGSLSTNVVNKAGSTLPSTGGVGTTLFYILGGILVVAAGVLLAAKRRMRAE